MNKLSSVGLKVGAVLFSVVGAFCAEAADGTLTISGSACDYFASENWADNQIAEGAGATATFKGAGLVQIAQPLTIGHFSAEVSGYSGFFGDEVTFSASSTPTVNVKSDWIRFRSYAPIESTSGLKKSGPGYFQLFAPLSAPGGINLAGGVLAIDFSGWAESAATGGSGTHENLLPNAPLSVTADSRIIASPASKRNQAIYTMSITEGSAWVATTHAADLTAGQLVETPAGEFPSGTFVHRVVKEWNLIEMSAPAMVSGDVNLTFKATTITASQTLTGIDLLAPLTLTGADLAFYVWGSRSIAGVGDLTIGADSAASLWLNAEDMHSSYYGKVTLNGKTNLVLHDLAEPSETLPVTDGCAFHVDASAASTLTTSEVDGRRIVTRWADASGGSNAAVSPTGAQPAVLLEDALNGLPVVDFGSCCGNGGMEWEQSVSGIRDVFVVIGSQNGGGTLLGTKELNDAYRYERGTDVLSTGAPGNYVVPLTKDRAILMSSDAGSVYLNGDSEKAAIDPTLSGLSGDYDLVEIKGSKDSVASAFARRAGLTDVKRQGREGGQRLAEVVIYNRNLSDRERYDVEAYLMKKWFGRLRRGYGAARVDRLDVVPPSGYYERGLFTHHTAGCPVEVNQLSIAADSGTAAPYYTVASGDNIVADRAFLGRKLRMMGGKVTVTAHQTKSELPVAGPSLHLDATKGVTVENGKVTRWEDASSGEGYAVPEDGYCPTVVADALNGKAVIDFGADASCQHLAWEKNRPVGTYFMVMKVTNRKVSFMGSSCGSMAVKDHFTRYTGTDCIYGSGSVSTLAGGKCWLDGALVRNPNESVLINGDFRIVSHALEAPLVANAFGCGAYQSSNHRAERTGGLQIAEAIIYDRKLTEEECLDVQAYLKWKWFGETLAGYAAPGESYELYGIGSGADGSELTIRGTAPVRIATERFGGKSLKVSAPETIVDFAGGFDGNNKGVVVNGGLVTSGKGLIPYFETLAGSKSGVWADEGQTIAVASLVGSGLFVQSGSGTVSVAAASSFMGALRLDGGVLHAPGAGLGVTGLSGSGTVTGGSLILKDGSEILVNVTPDGCDSVETQVLSVEGTGTIRLNFSEDILEPYGHYDILTFGTLDDDSRRRLLGGDWKLDISYSGKKRFVSAVRVQADRVTVDVARPGLGVIIR